MFEAEYTDVKLTKERDFPEIGKSDTLRVFEPTAGLMDKTFRDDEARQIAVRDMLRKNTFVLFNGTAIELNKKLSIFDFISFKEGRKLENNFEKLLVDEEETEQAPK